MSSEADFLELKGTLHGWSTRRVQRDGLVWVPRGLMVGLLLAAIIATLARLTPLLSNADLTYLVAALALLGTLVSLLLLLLRNSSLRQQAHFADRQFQLQERVVTAVEIHEGGIATSEQMERHQLVDTLTAVKSVDVRMRLPLRLNVRDWLVILLATGLITLAIVLPNPQGEILKRRRAIDRSIKEQAAALEAIRDELGQNQALTAAQRQELLSPIQGALEDLNEDPLSQEGAMATLSEAEAELRELAEQYSTEDLRQALQSSGQPLADNPLSQDFGQALQNGDLSKAGSAAAQLADALPELSSASRESLAEDIAATAQSLQGTDSELAQQLAEAAQSLREGNISGAQQALRNASATLQQRAQETAAAAQADAAASQVNQGRREIAQAGGSAQGQADGGGEAAGQGDGQGQGSGSSFGVQNDEGEGVGGPGPGGGHAENVYAPEHVDLGEEPGVDIELPAACVENPADCGALLGETPTEFTRQGSSVPYADVFTEYRDAAYEALSEEYIPLGLKDYVREYFSSLEP